MSGPEFGGIVDTIVMHRNQFYAQLDREALRLAVLAQNGQPITLEVLKVINILYSTAKLERQFIGNRFECAYHSPITADFEFFLARMIYHYAPQSKVYLRRQVGRMAPDIRVTVGAPSNEKTVAIIEIKVKAGWIQPFFSSDRELKDQKKIDAGNKTTIDPKRKIADVRGQLEKYQESFKI